MTEYELEIRTVSDGERTELPPSRSKWRIMTENAEGDVRVAIMHERPERGVR